MLRADRWMRVPRAHVVHARHLADPARGWAACSGSTRASPRSFGWGGREHFVDPDYLARLAEPAAGGARGAAPAGLDGVPRLGPRRRVPGPVAVDLRRLDEPAPGLRRASRCSCRRPRCGCSRAGRRATSTPTWTSTASRPRSLDDMPLAERPATLDRAALDYCLADAFHPGCEVTWPIRHASMYMAPFRIRHRAIGDPEPSPGKALTPDRRAGRRRTAVRAGPRRA